MKLQSKYIHNLAMKLAEDGQKLIEKAYLQASFNKDKTQNLHDSYGSAVFLNRKLYQGSKRYFSKVASVPRYNSYTESNEYGRDEINKFFDTYVPKDDGMQLVIAVAMFYGGILEAGKSPLRRKYQVISMVGDDIKALTSKIKGARVEVIQQSKIRS